jgi:hypothetical protein
MDNHLSNREELETKLSALEAKFEREMRARGFDPAQAENVPLTPDLARLYAEREELLEALSELQEIPERKA